MSKYNNSFLTIRFQDKDGSWETIRVVGVINFVFVIVRSQQRIVALHLIMHRRHTTAGVGDPHGVDILLLAPVGYVLPHGAVYTLEVLFPYWLEEEDTKSGQSVYLAVVVGPP